jgi:hypothetical protein
MEKCGHLSCDTGNTNGDDHKGAAPLPIPATMLRSSCVRVWSRHAMMRERPVLFASLSPRRGSGGVHWHGDGVEHPPWARHDPMPRHVVPHLALSQNKSASVRAFLTLRQRRRLCPQRVGTRTLEHVMSSASTRRALPAGVARTCMSGDQAERRRRCLRALPYDRVMLRVSRVYAFVGRAMWHDFCPSL